MFVGMFVSKIYAKILIELQRCLNNKNNKTKENKTKRKHNTT